MLFLVTKFSPTTPIILGMLWLQKHEPYFSFKEFKICFNSNYYSRNCLLWGIANSSRDILCRYLVLLSLVLKTTYKALTIKDVPNKREPMQLQSNKTAEDWTTPALKIKIKGQPALLRLKKVCFTLLLLRIQCQPKHPLNLSHPTQHPELSYMPYTHTTACVTARTGYGTTET